MSTTTPISDTPRTDAMMHDARPFSWRASYGRAVEFARTLERENIILKGAFAASVTRSVFLAKDRDQHERAKVAAEYERDQWREVAEKLAHAHYIIDSSIRALKHREALAAFDRLKGAK